MMMHAWAALQAGQQVAQPTAVGGQPRAASGQPTAAGGVTDGMAGLTVNDPKVDQQTMEARAQAKQQADYKKALTEAEKLRGPKEVPKKPTPNYFRTSRTSVIKHDRTGEPYIDPESDPSTYPVRGPKKDWNASHGFRQVCAPCHATNEPCDHEGPECELCKKEGRECTWVMCPETFDTCKKGVNCREVHGAYLMFYAMRLGKTTAAGYRSAVRTFKVWEYPAELNKPEKHRYLMPGQGIALPYVIGKSYPKNNEGGFHGTYPQAWVWRMFRPKIYKAKRLEIERYWSEDAVKQRSDNEVRARTQSLKQQHAGGAGGVPPPASLTTAPKSGGEKLGGEKLGGGQPKPHEIKVRQVQEQKKLGEEVKPKPQETEPKLKEPKPQETSQDPVVEAMEVPAERRDECPTLADWQKMYRREYRKKYMDVQLELERLHDDEPLEGDVFVSGGAGKNPSVSVHHLSPYHTSC